MGGPLHLSLADSEGVHREQVPSMAQRRMGEEWRVPEEVLQGLRVAKQQQRKLSLLRAGLRRARPQPGGQEARSMGEGCKLGSVAAGWWFYRTPEI